MRVVIIGGTGHIGTYLTPMLVEAGHEVVSISRGLRSPYLSNAAWKKVQKIDCDRTEEETSGGFGERIAALDAECVIDLTCYLPESARLLAETLRRRIQHFLHCGTIWVHGHSVELPTTESEPRRPFGIYGERKAEIERYLLGESGRYGFPVTILHPGHLVGTGWDPINPQGNFNFEIFLTLQRGEELLMPNFGMETVHHVHAADVAGAFVAAINHRGASVGESFHIVSEAALTFRGYAERMAEWFGKEPSLRFLPWDEWRKRVSDKDAQISLDHLQHSPNCSIAKARRSFGFVPRYSSLQAVREAVDYRLKQSL